MKNKLIMKYPSTWHSEMWKEGAPFGNGIIGGLVYGGATKEIIAVNHAFLWRGGSEQEMPDVSDCLPEIRRLLDKNEVIEADKLLANTLRERGYSPDFCVPNPLCDLVLKTFPRDVFENYRREIDMSKAEVTVSWNEDVYKYNRRVFVSRENNLIFMEYTCNGGKMNVDISLNLHDTETLNGVNIPNQEVKAQNDCLYYAAYNESVYKAGDFGAVARVITDGEKTVKDSEICIKDANKIFVVMGVFVDCPRDKAFKELTQTVNNDFDYETELSKHAKIHSEIFNRVDFSISDEEKNTCNEELLLQAFDTSASNEMIEKLYAYGRYLFICSTGEKNTLPCDLVGLFNGSYQCFWAFNMFNVNFQMIYWQALTGNMPSFLKLALSYVESMIPQFKENAKKIFGCRGILINSVNTPESGLFKCLANHIVNWTGGAAWVSQHFWDYYRFTQDIDYLKEHTLPFMYETALFYEDFVVENEDGYYDIYPSVSPENTASNVMEGLGLEGVETSKNATMEIALLKELLTNLLKGCEITGMYPEKIAKWQEMLSKIPPYQINEDGAVKEWTHPYYIDNYCHRHHSHIYPIFPGNEITSEDDIYSAFEKAEDMRLEFGISDQSSWSIVYMACIAARMKRGDFALKMIEAMAKTSLMNNFFTVHNDWRRMGAIYCGDFRVAPFQIDGNIGIPGAINEMLIQSQNDDITVLPALPAKWEKGSVKGLLVRGNIICDIEWDNESVIVTLKSDIKQTKKIVAGSGYSFENGEKEISSELDGQITVKLCK